MPLFKKKSTKGDDSSSINYSQEDLSARRNQSSSPPPPSYRSSPSVREPSNPYARAQDPYARGQDQYASRDYSSARPAVQRGRSNESQGDNNRNALFGNRPPPQRQQQDPYARSSNYNQDDPYSRGYDTPAANGEPDRYDEYQKQFEENPEEEIESIKQEIRFTKQKSLASTRNAIAKAQEAEETGRYALTRLGEQHAKFANIERSMDIARSQAEDAHGQTKLLKTLNETPFFIPVKDPSRKKGYEERAAQRYEEEMEAAEQRRRDVFEYNSRIDTALDKPGSARALKKKHGAQPPKKAGIEERSKYMFEPDAEDDQVEKDIDANLHQLSDITGRLKHLAIATQKELDHQNEQIDRISRTGEDTQRRVHLNTKRLETIR